MSITSEERLATLEEKVDRIEKQLVILHEIKDEMTKYKGFIGGVVFLATCFTTFALSIKDYLKIKIGV